MQKSDIIENFSETNPFPEIETAILVPNDYFGNGIQKNRDF